MELFGNGINTTLSGDVASGDLTFDVVSTSGMPTPSGGNFFRLIIVRASDGTIEIVYVTNVTGSTLTVTRAREGTVALDLESGDAVKHVVTAGMLNGLSSRDTLTISTPSGSAASKSVTIQVSRAGYFFLRCQLCDSATPTGLATLNPPTGSSNVDFTKVTASDGSVTLTFTNGAASRAYYLHVNMNGEIFVSDAINIGT